MFETFLQTTLMKVVFRKEFADKEPEPTACRSTRSTAGKQGDPNREPCPAARMNSVAALQ